MQRLARLACVMPIFLAATPAFADDWTLSCSYPQQNLELLAHYNAGDPSYSLTVRRAGSVEIPVRVQQDANIIMSRDELILFTHNTEPNALQLLWRLDTEQMTSNLEIGSGVSWTRASLEGRCRQIEPTR